ncbi:LPS-assembly protein LptD [Teredinibacter purpureus]|uniref:LPS-assembly protein LptD n=1 Tax=Teredinibacter purpureus TaxID=2731756 RepID=UPI000696537A|nr:LPS-assembly protein LptD [Teredinibacter purpureus]
MPKSFARHKPSDLPRQIRGYSVSKFLILTSALVSLSITSLFGHAEDELSLKNQPLQARYDWQTFDELTLEQQLAVPVGCEGAYIDPMKNVAKSLGARGNNLEEFPLEIEANQTVVRAGEVAQLEGNVILSQGARTINADKMTYNILDNEASMEGHVVIRQPGILLHGSEAKASGSDHSASFTDAEFVLHDQHLRGSAGSISQSSEQVIELTNGSFTSCEPDSNAWVLQGERITIDPQNQQGTGHNIQLRVLDVPVIYLPYITFPVGSDRKSGLLFPSISISERNGVDLAVPYYFNLAPHYDATVTPRIISKRGLMLETEGRHLSRAFATTVDLAFLANDKGGRSADLNEQINAGLITEEEASPYQGENRWLGHLLQYGGDHQQWFSEIEYTQVSDNDYFRDLGISSFSVQNTTHLDQSVSAGYRFDHWHLSALAQNYQILLYDVDDPYQRLPHINFTGNFQQGSVGTELHHEYTNFGHGDDYWSNGKQIIKGQRFTTDYRTNISKRASWGFFKPELGLQSLSYQLNEAALSSHANSAPTLATASASLDMGLIFDNPRGKYLQTLEPRLFYLYRSYDDHSELFNLTDDGQSVNFDTTERTFSYSQLYRDSRFSGHDRLEDANRATFGVTSNWYDNDSGEELLSVSLGQTFYLQDQRVSIDQSVNNQEQSEFAGELRMRLGPWGRFFASSIFDSESNLFTRGSAGVQLNAQDDQSLLNLGYSYVRQDANRSTGIDQLDFSFVKPIAKQWVSMARYNYDFTSQRELEAFAGLEYNDCCYRVRLLARRWLDSNIAALTESNDALYDQGVFFEIHLKGLGSSGAKVDAILEDSIYGYREREKRLNK